jgi:hypothetical protein
VSIRILRFFVFHCWWVLSISAFEMLVLILSCFAFLVLGDLSLTSSSSYSSFIFLENLFICLGGFAWK